MPNDIADWTNAVQVSGGSVTISGTANVSVTNTPSVTISGTPAVTVSSGTVSISGTPTVNIAAGQSISISGTPTVNIATGQSISITGTPTVSISGTPSITIASGTVNVGNSPNITAILNNVVVDSLYNSGTITPSTTAVTHTITSPTHQYAGFLVNFQFAQGGTIQVCIAIQNTTQGINSAYQTVSQINGIQTSYQLYFPVPADAGDTVKVVYQTTTGSAPSASLNVWGIGAPMTAMPELRPDGRLRPIGMKMASTSASGGTVIAAVTGCSILIHSITLMAFAANAAAASIQFQLDGTVTQFLTVEKSEVVAWSPPGGILCDIGTAVTISGGTTSGFIAVVVYDVVR